MIMSAFGKVDMSFHMEGRMVGEDRVIMSVKELRRVHVIRQTREQKLTQVVAGILLGLTTRHIQRLING